MKINRKRRQRSDNEAKKEKIAWTAVHRNCLRCKTIRRKICASFPVKIKLAELDFFLAYIISTSVLCIIVCKVQYTVWRGIESKIFHESKGFKTIYLINYIRKCSFLWGANQTINSLFNLQSFFELKKSLFAKQKNSLSIAHYSITVLTQISLTKTRRVNSRQFSTVLKIFVFFTFEG